MKSEGFTLIEIIAVIAVISILATIAIQQFTEYQEKAKVTNFALNIVSHCAKDAIGDCISQNVSAPTNYSLNELPNCSNIQTAMGYLTVILDGQYICLPQGVATGSVRGVISELSRYTAVCDFHENSLKCYVK
ncbi:prepilin-type N-terminal cleavage/methylation domain-containing protein [Thermodesulfovibrio sp. 1176]|uniref:prepilin-type N-terminal cleavage/methylation domain-containing protein n=1 Tax=Thermodesulfovibrio sp. 1176 TaxID=3043424 RepID=UPI002482E2C9|nr:prepilin-type N-terminal cleavage/methylation domain-containing protein [Thermodesulfovibrio sp. 1176]MDI1471131.1 prepilin-type N-terminal cleavage/methylation domain-containing protein [Thermodesulfovibrio sp. 1176]